VSEFKLPTRTQTLRILARAGCSPRVIEHCREVSKFSVKIARAFQKKDYTVDVQLVEVAGLLHDIGRSKTHTVHHGIIGGEIAQSFDLPDAIVQVIQRHVGGGVPKEEAKQLGWPPKDYLPQTLEEKIVCYADKRVQGLRIVPIEQAIKTYMASLGENHPAIGRIKKLHEEIVSIVGDVL